MAKIAKSIGLDPEQAQNIDVVAALFYAALSRSLLRAATGNGRADDKLVDMLQVLLKALDPSELRVSGYERRTPAGTNESCQPKLAVVPQNSGIATKGAGRSSMP